MSTLSTLSVVNNNGSLVFDSSGKHTCTSSAYSVSSNSKYKITAEDNIEIESNTGNLTINTDIGILTLQSSGNYSNAIIINSSNSNGGISQLAGSSGINLTSSNGDINLLSQGADINIGVSPSGTLPSLLTQNITIENANNLNVSSGDMYFISSEILSFISKTGDIEFGTSSNSAPVLKFENGNVLINQSSSNLDYQLDIAITNSSNNSTKNGYNGIMVNSTASNVAADITLQTSNSNLSGDQTQCILTMGSFGADSNSAIYQQYLAYQTGNVVIRLDGPSYSQNAIYNGFGHDFEYSDIGRQIYWTQPTNRQDTIIGLGTFVFDSNDTSNVSISGTYTDNISRVYLLQIDSVSAISPYRTTFKWSNDGGVSFQAIYVPIVDTITPIALDYGLFALFAHTSGYTYNQQFTFQTKITAIVSSQTSITIPQTMYTLQPFHSYINTTTPSDIVIKTNNSEKMRITGDGAIGIQQQIPNACFDLNSNYNKVILVNQSITGYQLNPSISYLESGGYVIVWNTQDTSGPIYNFNVKGQRYLADGSRYGSNFNVNVATNLNQSFPSVAGNRKETQSNTNTNTNANANANNFIVVWTGNGNIAAPSKYKVYCQIYKNSTPIQSTDIQIDDTNSTTSNQLYAKCAGLYNGNYVIVWSADDTNSGIYTIYGKILDSYGNTVTGGSKFQINNTGPTNPYSNNYPYVAGLPSSDSYYPNGFVVSYMTATSAIADPRYTITMRVLAVNPATKSAEIPITYQSGNIFSNISDGLVSVAEISKHNVNKNTNTTQNTRYGNFLLSFYRSYQADTSLYNIGDNVSGVISGATATISALYPSQRIITLQNVSSSFLVAEEIEIVSSNVSVGNIIEKIAGVSFTSNITTSFANITLDIGSKDVLSYCFQSNVSSVSDAVWKLQVNTSPLYNDIDRYSGNSAIFQYKRPLSSITVDNNGTALVAWSNDSIPSVYYQLINTDTGELVSTEKRLTSQYDGLKQRDQVATHLQSIQGNDYGFVISWDNQSLDLHDTGIYQQLVGYNHSLFSLTDGNSSLIFNHQNQLGIGTLDPLSILHMKSPNTSTYGDPSNPCTLTIQNTAQHVITNTPLQSISFLDGSSNTLNQIQSVNSFRYDDLYPQPTNLIGFYKFDQTQGTQVIDSTASSTFANQTNSVPAYITTNGILYNFDIENCWTPGVINNALLYNGVNNYVSVDKSAQNNLNVVLESTASHQLSISVWVNIPSSIIIGAQYDIISNGGNLTKPGTYLLGLCDLHSNGHMFATSNIIVNGPLNRSLQGTTILNDSKWHNIVETIDLSSVSQCVIKLYVDGKLEASSTTAGVIDTKRHDVDNTYFGSRDGSNANTFFRGYMDELRFYDSILTSSEIEQIYKYGNANQTPKSSLVLSCSGASMQSVASMQTGSTSTSNVASSIANQSIVIDDNGNINNLTSRPLPYSIISGELIAYSSNTTIHGINTKFDSELTVGDIVVLGGLQGDYTIITISSDTLATIDRQSYTGVETSITYQSVLRRPSIYTFFDNSDSIRGHIDNYGNMIIGNSKPATMLEISGVSGDTNNTPELTITNKTNENTQYGRKTAVNFRCYDAITTPTSHALYPPTKLGSIETSYNGNTVANFDNQGIMKFSLNNGANTMKTLLSLTSYGNIGIGGDNNGQNLPITLMHATTQNTATECALLLQSNYENNGGGGFSVYDERSDLYFAGVNSIAENTNPNIKKRMLAGISGSKDVNYLSLNGRLDLMTNNDIPTTKNGLESRMSITHLGYVGVNIMQPANAFNVAPELRPTNGNPTTINTPITNGGMTITLSNNLFSVFATDDQKAMFVGGSVVVMNNTLTRATIVSVNSINNITVNIDLSAYVGFVIHIHYAGLNVNSSNGFTGINTTQPNSVLSVAGSLSLPIVSTTSSITLNSIHHTVICKTASNTITISLPTNSSALLGRIYVIKKYGANACTVDTDGTALIDGQNTQTIVNYSHLQSDGVDWWQIASG